MKKRACMFCGHRYVIDWTKLHKNVTSMAVNLIETEGVNVFYLSDTAGINDVCSFALKVLSLDYPDVKTYVVTPRMTRKIINSSRYYEFMFDGIINLDLKDKSYIDAVKNMNEWMVDNSDYIITHMHMNYGRAYKILKYGKEKNKNIIRV